MTADELRAAAERVRRCEAGEHPTVVYGEQWDYAGMLESDRIDLADAYFAEEELREEIGNLLDHWEGVASDLKNRETLGNLPLVMERIRKMVEARND